MEKTSNEMFQISHQIPRIFSSSIIMACLICVLLGSVLNISAQETSDAVLLYDLFERADTFDQQGEDELYPDILPDAQEARARYWLSVLDDLQKIKRTDLGPQDLINYDVFEYVTRDKYDRLRLETYLIPFNAEGGFYNSLSYRLGRDFDDPEDYNKFITRLRAYPAYMRDNMELMRIGLKKGMVSPKLIASNYKVLIEPFMKMDLDSNQLYQPFRNIPKSFSDDQKTKLTSEGKQILMDSIIPVYQEFTEFMEEEYIPGCPDEIGISAIPGGDGIYEQRISFFTSLDMTPDEVYEKGLAEVARIRTDMESIIREVEFEGSFEDFLTFLRTDPQFYATTPRGLLMEASYIAKKIDGLLPKYFDRLPSLSYGVLPVPEAIAPTYTGGRYSGGSWDRHQAGNYWVNTYRLDSRPLYILPALTLHEAVPGHHLQISLSQELKDLPKFRNQTYISAFGEGWALYCEWLGQEMGIYETPYEQFGRLTYEMWRACRLVVDVGMHMKGWSREKAFDFLSSNTALSIHECNTEINRYIGWPGQAVSYKIGELKIRELRSKAEELLGDKFDLRSFHDTVLENGSVPLFVLEEQIDQYIQQQLSP